jgi:FkbM family methyltransferase
MMKNLTNALIVRWLERRRARLSRRNSSGVNRTLIRSTFLLLAILSDKDILSDMIGQVKLRDGTGDGFIYGEIFNRGDYDALKQCKFDHPPRILDLGAHIGLFALWCDRQWPGCHIYCVEPVQENIDLLMQNCIGIRHLTVRQAAIGLAGHNRAWLTNEGKHSFSYITVYASKDRDGEGVPCVTMNSLLTETTAFKGLAFDNFDIIKMDIEGAEDAAFQSFGEWNRYAHYLAVECHRKWIPEAMGIEDLYRAIGRHRKFRVMDGGSDSLAFVELLP